MPRRPTLRQHVRGSYFTEWNGRRHWLGTTKSEAEKLFLSPAHPGSLIAWQRWAETVTDRRKAARARTTIAEVAAAMLAEFDADGRGSAERYFRLHLRRFLNVMGRLYADELDEVGIAAFVSDLKTIRVRDRSNPKRTTPIKPKTVGHDITAIKRLCAWASSPSRKMMPALALHDLRRPRVPRSRPEPIEPDEIRSMIKAAESITPELGAMLRLNYLGVLRPSEVVRLSLGAGRVVTVPRSLHFPPVARGMIELDEHKTSAFGVGSEPRYILLSDEARMHFDSLRPLPVTRRRARAADPSDIQYHQNRYAKACRDAGVPGLPHKLRDSAATHLRQLGESHETVDLLLGHRTSGTLHCYAAEALHLLRQSAARLTLR